MKKKNTNKKKQTLILKPTWNDNNLNEMLDSHTLNPNFEKINNYGIKTLMTVDNSNNNNNNSKYKKNHKNNEINIELNQQNMKTNNDNNNNSNINNNNFLHGNLWIDTFEMMNEDILYKQQMHGINITNNESKDNS